MRVLGTGVRAFNPIALGFNSLHALQRGSVNPNGRVIGSLGEQTCVEAPSRALSTCKAQVTGESGQSTCPRLLTVFRIK